MRCEKAASLTLRFILHFPTTELDIYCFVGKPKLTEEQRLINTPFLFPFHMERKKNGSLSHKQDTNSVVAPPSQQMNICQACRDAIQAGHSKLPAVAPTYFQYHSPFPPPYKSFPRSRLVRQDNM